MNRQWHDHINSWICGCDWGFVNDHSVAPAASVIHSCEHVGHQHTAQFGMPAHHGVCHSAPSPSVVQWEFSSLGDGSFPVGRLRSVFGSIYGAVILVEIDCVVTKGRSSNLLDPELIEVVMRFRKRLVDGCHHYYWDWHRAFNAVSERNTGKQLVRDYGHLAMAGNAVKGAMLEGEHQPVRKAL